MELSRRSKRLRPVRQVHHNRNRRHRLGLTAATLVVLPVIANVRVAGADPTTVGLQPSVSEPALVLPGTNRRFDLPFPLAAAISSMTAPPATEERAAAPPADPAQPLVDFALAQVGLPYRFAAAGPQAFDCSGLTMAAYRALGIELPHKSERQVGLGRAVEWSSEPIKAGDLIFTTGSRPVHAYGHVGLAISDSEWVVAPRSGRRVTREPIPFGRIDAVRRVLEG
jgi:peptidoglycan DL-endopeptidase CwlO